jgi:16S rRNA (uracil1498-N3)-methyltransferase
MRQLVLSALPDRNGNVLLGERDWRYLSQVLRKEAGDLLEARLPDGSLCSMRVESIDRRAKTVTLTLAGSLSVSCDSPARQAGAGDSMPAIPEMPSDFPPIILFQWILKGPRMDQVIRQATETGVCMIVPVAGERCLSSDAEKVGDGKTGRWERIVREALQQSGSPVPTKILAPVAPSAIRAVWQNIAELSGERNSVALVLTEAPLARKSLHEYLVSAAGATALAVGPEGGMTSGELALLAEAGFACVHFKTNILRAETAALYGIAAVQSTLLESVNWQLKE